MFVIRTAGLNIGIDNRYELSKTVCSDFCVEDGQTDFTIRITDKFIQKVIKWCIKNNGERIAPNLAENNQLRYLIHLRLLEYNAFYLHACVVEMDGIAYAFSGDSGVGKSTHAALWLRMFGNRARVINGDNPFIRRIGNVFYAYGTPWGGKEGWRINTSAPLRGICFLEQAPVNSIIQLQPLEGFTYLWHNSGPMDSEAKMNKFMRLMDTLLSEVPVFLLRCNTEDEAAIIAYRAMTGHV